MPRYALKFSHTTGCSSLHTHTCRNALSGKEQTTAFFDAVGVADALDVITRDAKLTQRGFPRPVVCECLAPNASAPQLQPPSFFAPPWWLRS